MDPFFYATNLSKLVQQIESILIVICLVALIVAVSERWFGLDIRRAVDKLEAAQTNGNPWPITVLLVGGLAAIIWMVRGF